MCRRQNLLQNIKTCITKITTVNSSSTLRTNEKFSNRIRIQTPSYSVFEASDSWHDYCDSLHEDYSAESTATLQQWRISKRSRRFSRQDLFYFRCHRISLQGLMEVAEKDTQRINRVNGVAKNED